MQLELMESEQNNNYPVTTYLATLEDNGPKVRTVIIRNPVTDEMDGGFVLRDVADALSYCPRGLKRIYTRSKWLRKYLTGVVTSAVDQKQREHDVIIGREGLLGGFMKLQTNRIKDVDKRDRIDAIQEQLIKILVSALAGYNRHQSHRNRVDMVQEDIRLKARIELLKAMSGAQIKSMIKLYGPLQAQEVMNELLGIDGKEIHRRTYGF